MDQFIQVEEKGDGSWSMSCTKLFKVWGMVVAGRVQGGDVASMLSKCRCVQNAGAYATKMHMYVSDFILWPGAGLQHGVLVRLSGPLIPWYVLELWSLFSQLFVLWGA